MGMEKEMTPEEERYLSLLDLMATIEHRMTQEIQDGAGERKSSNIVKNLSDALYKVSASAKIFYDMGVKEGQ